VLAACGGQADERADTQAATSSTGTATTPPPSLTDACGSAPGIEGRPLWLKTEDGIRLYAVEIGAGPIGIVLAHQAPASLCGWLPSMRALAAEGFRVLAFDFRSYGNSPSPPDADARLALGTDLAAAVARLRPSGAAKVFLIGASLGGAAAVQAGASLPVDGIVSLSGTRFFPGYGVNDPDAVRRLRVPFLFVGSRKDSRVPVAEAMDVLRQIGSSDKRTRFYPGSWHGWGIVQDAPHAAEARELVVHWVRARS
jgi:dienelactone hydrolase